MKPIMKEAPKYKPFYEQIGQELKAANKDNDFIFHMPVPAADKLDAISPAVVAKPVDHQKSKLLMEGDNADIFEAVVPIQVGSREITVKTQYYLLIVSLHYADKARQLSTEKGIMVFFMCMTYLSKFWISFAQ